MPVRLFLPVRRFRPRARQIGRRETDARTMAGNKRIGTDRHSVRQRHQNPIFKTA